MLFRSYNIVDEHSCILEITNLVGSSSQSSASSNKLLNISQSHYIGMELISKLCAKMAFKWNLVQNKELITFALNIPLVIDATSSENPGFDGILV